MPINRIQTISDSAQNSGPVDPHRDSLHKEFVRLIIANHNRMYAYILSMVPDRHDANDILQETTLAMWEKFDQFNPQQSFFRWGVGFARNMIKRFHQQNQKGYFALDPELINQLSKSRVGLDELFEVRRRAMDECLNQLPQKQQDLLSTCYNEHTTIQAAAESLGKSATSLYKSLNRIRKRLVDCVDRRLKLAQREQGDQA